MFGPALLVAPVFVPQGEDSEYYLPAGRWTSFFHPQHTLDGPTWVREAVPLDEIPVWVRPGTVLCLGPRGMGRPDYELSKGVEVQVYELAERQIVQTEVPTGNGARVAGTVRAERQGQEDVVVSVIAGDVAMASVTLFTGGQMRRVNVGKGQNEVVLKL